MNDHVLIGVLELESGIANEESSPHITVDLESAQVLDVPFNFFSKGLKFSQIEIRGLL
jgi:hypothetical protein